MTDQQLSKAWATVALFLLVFTLDSWLRTQGLSPMFGSHLPHEQRSAAAVFGFVFSSIAIALLLRIAFAYTRRQPSGGLASRLPIAFFASLDTGQPEAVSYQRVMFFMFHLLPILALTHFLRIVLNSRYFLSSDCKQSGGASHSVWAWPDARYEWNNGYRLDSCDGVTFFPVLEPLLLVVVMGSLCAATGYYCFLLWGRFNED